MKSGSKSLVLTVALLLFCSVQALANELKISGWLFQSYVEISENHIPEEGFRGREIGLRADIEIQKYLTFRSLMKAENSAEDDPVKLVFALLDYQFAINGLSLSARAGRLEMPFGFQSDVKNSNPRNRLSPLSTSGFPQNLAWGYQDKLFSSVDGYSLTASINSFPASMRLEIVRGKRDDLEPQINYVQELDGITAERQIVHHGAQFDARFRSTKIRIIELKMETIFDISPRHWNEYLSQKVGFPIPEQVWVTGEHGVNYVYNYFGFEQYFDSTAFSFENILFHYKRGTAERYYNAIGADMTQKTNNFRNYLIKHHINRAVMLYAGRGFDSSSGNDAIDSRSYAGLNYLFSPQIDIKMLYEQNDGYGFLSWKQNPSKPNLSTPEETRVKREFEIYAVSINYSF